MSEARSLTNLIGNGVTAIVIAKWEDSFNPAKENLDIPIFQATACEHPIAKPNG